VQNVQFFAIEPDGAWCPANRPAAPLNGDFAASHSPLGFFNLSYQA